MPLTLSGSNGITFPNASTQGAGTDLINNTGASSDIVLNMGQTAYVNFTSATSIPLRIATSANQMYELSITSTGTSSNLTAFLNLNNSTAFTYSTFQMYATSSPASGATAFNFISTDTGFRLAIGGTLLFANAKIITNTTYKSMTLQGRDTSASVGYAYQVTTNCTDQTTVWTSLGTIASGTALTGTVWIRRVG